MKGQIALSLQGKELTLNDKVALRSSTDDNDLRWCALQIHSESFFGELTDA